MSEQAVLNSKYVGYADYKDSGVEWVGQIPSDWEMWKIAHAYDVIGSGTTPTTSEEGWFGDGTPWVTTGELRESLIEQTKKMVTAEAMTKFSALRVHPAGSVVMAMYGATIGRLGILGVSATTNQACCVLTRSEQLDNNYVFHWLRAFRDDIINLSSGGGQPNINQEKVASLKVSAPAIEEQRTIAAFLDYETARIDSLIDKQQRLIELLKEKRQAVISHAVTKGLNPDAPMKDSGVEWLGQVPEHWEVKKFNHCARIRNGLVDPTDIRYRDLVLYAPNHIEKETGKVIYRETALEQGADSNKYLCLKGEVIYSKIRPALAKVALCVEEIALCSADMYPISCTNGLSNSWLYWFMLSDNFTKAVVLDSDRVAMPKVNRDSLGAYRIPFPSTDEQVEISSFLRSQTEKLDQIENEAVNAIQLMQERRTALISAAVTGKIDLRRWTPPREG